MRTIKIEVDDNSYARMLKGLRVEGTVGFDPRKKLGDLNAFKRQPRRHRKNLLLKKTPWGWLKASFERLKRYSSVPSDLTLAEQLAIFDEENELIKAALIERELNKIEFC